VIMGPLGIVINPTSGKGRGKADGEAAKKEFSKHGIDLVDLSADNFIAASNNANKAIKDKTISGLIVVGGDGMFHLAVNAAAKTEYPGRVNFCWHWQRLSSCPKTSGPRCCCWS